jgi:UDP-2,3-diacylglucosamine hydrolase
MTQSAAGQLARPRSRVLLISDLHLEEARPELTQAFADFLAREAPTARALYILGDFFNVWLGDDDDRPLRDQISVLLRQYSTQWLAIYLMHGNRDFLLGSQFADACGATVLAEPYLLTHQGQSYLLQHGDALCMLDSDYQQFRQLVRNPIWQQQFISKPLNERRAFAEQARARSKTMNSNKADDIMDVTQAAVEQALQQQKVSTLIHGHTHRPAVHLFEVNDELCQRIVLGDWGTQGWFVEIDKAASLHNFAIP